MTTFGMITTFAGGFLAAFILTMGFGQMVNRFGPIGGWLAGGFIVGTMWALNHSTGIGIAGITQNLVPGVSNLMVQGQNSPWVDQAWPIVTGIMANGAVSGAKLGKAMPTWIAAILGGIVAGFVLSCIGR